MTAGTVLHNSKTKLTTWFWAAYLVTTDKRGVSALLLQRQLAIGRYETAWMILHKLRRAMVNRSREPLRGEVEVDDTWVGGPQAGLRGSRQLKGRKAALVLVGVERRGRGSGRARMEVIPDFKGPTVLDFVRRNVEAGATIYTDGAQELRRIRGGRVQARPTCPTATNAAPTGAPSPSSRSQTGPLGNMQNWLIGTHHGVSRPQLPAYLDEFVFRLNRRRTPQAAFPRRCSASEAPGGRRPTSRSVMAGTASHNLWGDAETTGQARAGKPRYSHSVVVARWQCDLHRFVR